MAADLATAALQRGLSLVDHVVQSELAGSPPPGVTRLAERAGMDKGQASRVLKDLCGIGILARDAQTRGFEAGPRLFGVAAGVSGVPCGPDTRAELRRLGAEHRASAYLSVLADGAVLVVRAEPGAWAASIGLQAGRRVPAWCSGAGRALLLDRTAEELAELYRDVEFIGAGGPAAPRTVAELADRVAKARQAAAVVAIAEFEQDVIEVGAPVRDRRGDIVAAVSVVTTRVHAQPDPGAMSASVARAAARLSSPLAAG